MRVALFGEEGAVHWVDGCGEASCGEIFHEGLHEGEAGKYDAEVELDCCGEVGVVGYECLVWECG